MAEPGREGRSPLWGPGSPRGVCGVSPQHCFWAFQAAETVPRLVRAIKSFNLFLNLVFRAAAAQVPRGFQRFMVYRLVVNVYRLVVDGVQIGR